jgi:class 3 adenylate cyclase
VHRFFELAFHTVQQYEGNIQHYADAGFLALFGAPVTYEDHARRALLAALEIQRRPRQYRALFGAPSTMALMLQSGIHTGGLVERQIGNAERTIYMALGDTLRLVAQLQQWAAPDTILLSEAAARLVHGAVRIEACGPVSVAEDVDPITVYRVVEIEP